MKILFWNIRGFGKPSRRKQIKDYIKQEDLMGIGLLETMKGDFTHSELGEILGGIPFKWVWKGSLGHSSGILIGVREDAYEVEDIKVGDCFVSMVLRNRCTNFRWELITVYGPTQQEASSEFITELSRKCMFVVLPIVFGVTLILLDLQKTRTP
jgi:hypothetical protein